MRVAVVYNAVQPDGRPDQEDTLLQARAVHDALIRRGHAAELLSMTLDLHAASLRIAALNPDVVFNLVEELDGDIAMAPLAPALFAHAGIPFTGADAASMTLSGSKLLCKQILTGADICTPAWVTADGVCGGMGDLPRTADAFIPGRYLCKSVHEHASLGLDDSCIVDAVQTGDVMAALMRCRTRHGGTWFAEQYVEGRAFNIAAIADGNGGVHVLPCAEIEFRGYAPERPRIVGYAAKWHQDSFECSNTVRRFDFCAEDSALLELLRTVTVRCWRAFGLAGYARIDFRVKGDGSPQAPYIPCVIDVNSNPCIAPDAGLAAAAEKDGMDYAGLVEGIVQAAVKEDRPPCRRP